MAQRSAAIGRDASVHAQTAHDGSETTLNVADRLAEVFKTMGDKVRETEAHAKSLCQDAFKRLELSEKRLETAEHSRLEIINDASCKLQEASRALAQAQSRIIATENQLEALEIRAQTAEAEAREAKEALAAVEEAIRKRLLRAS